MSAQYQYLRCTICYQAFEIYTTGLQERHRRYHDSRGERPRGPEMFVGPFELSTQEPPRGPQPQPTRFMSVAQESHLAGIKSTFDRLVDAKYRAGVREHGGNVFDLTQLALVDAAIDEAVDQVVYLLTLRDKVVEAMSEDVG